MNACKSLFTLVLGVTAAVANADVLISIPPNPGTCTPSQWKITGAVQTATYNSNGNVIPAIPGPLGPISATSCAGVYGGNDGPHLNPSPNLGYLGDGLLNGEGNHLSPTQFITPDQLLDLNPATPGAKQDPGWIKLLEVDGEFNAVSFASVDPEGVAGPFSLSSVLKFTYSETTESVGTWMLSVDEDVVAKLTAAGLFKRSFFDHLAFSVKSGNDNSDGGWAVYDFDFNIINDNAPGAFDLQTPYTFAGSWTTKCDFGCQGGQDGLKNGKAISHFSVWARDPLTADEVPEPAGLALVGLGLLALAYSRKARRAH